MLYSDEDDNVTVTDSHIFQTNSKPSEIGTNLHISSPFPQLDGNITLGSSDDEENISAISSIVDSDDPYNTSTSDDEFKLWHLNTCRILQNSLSPNSKSLHSDLSITDHEAYDDLEQFEIPVVVGNRPSHTTRAPGRHPTRVTVRRDNRSLFATSLPSIFVTNHRSLFPKFHSFLDEMIEMDMQLGLHSEIWEVSENKNHQQSVEEAFELHGIRYISNPRRHRRGGGVAITLHEQNFLLSRLDVSVPPELEVVWGLVKPKNPSHQVKSIVVCSFYSPPNSKKKSQLVEHIGVNFYKQKSLHPDSFFVCGGDKNDLNARLLLNISPTLHQIVTRPTYRNSILDIIVTDLGHLYHEPIIRPPVNPDDPKHGVPSDHSIALALPIMDHTKPPKRDITYKQVRPLNLEQKKMLADWIQYEDWSILDSCSNSSEMVECFSNLTLKKLDEICPLKSVKITKFDQEITSTCIKELSRKKNREYLKNRNSSKYKRLKKELKSKIKSEGAKLIQKQIDLLGEKGNNWFRFAKKITTRPGEDTTDSFTLPSHVEANLTADQSAAEICRFFSSISQEFKPLDLESLPTRVSDILNEPCCPHPDIIEHEIYHDMLKAKKTDSVPGDIPKNILTEFLPEFTGPISTIIRTAINLHEWPDSFKKEYHLPIKKTPFPMSEDDLRGKVR